MRTRSPFAGKANESAKPSAVALIVDFDNVWVGLGGTGASKATPKALARTLRSVAERFGRVVHATIYVSNPRRVAGLIQTFAAHGYDAVMSDNPYHSNIDVRLVLDCQALVFTRPDIGTYVLASGDSDLAQLAETIVERHKNLVVVAPSASTSSLVTAKAQTFIPLEGLFSETSPSHVEMTADRPVRVMESGTRPTPVRKPNPSPRRRPSLKVFLCHSKADKKEVRLLYSRLKGEPGVEPWLDEKDLVAGQQWEPEIIRAVKKSHCVIVCLSSHAVGAAGFVHKEIQFALDVADMQPDGTIFLIPVKFDECEVPDRLRRYHWVDFFEPEGYSNLMRSLHTRANALVS